MILNVDLVASIGVLILVFTIGFLFGKKFDVEVVETCQSCGKTKEIKEMEEIRK